MAFALAGIKGCLACHELSPEYAYLAAVYQSPSWQPNTGLDVRVAVSATNTGLPEECDYPYQQDEPAHPLPALPVGLSLYGPQLTFLQKDLSVVRDRLAAGEPVGTLIALTPSFMCPKNGIVMFEAGTYQGLHAVVIVGFGLDQAGQEYYLICNSWGHSWGIEGHAWLPAIYLEHHSTCIYGVA